jgi:hypothetical protein
MTAYVWNNVNGDWNNASNWNPVGVPGPGDSATIDGAATVAITVDKGSVAQSLTLSDPNATISTALGGALTIGGALNLDAGAMNVGRYSRLSIGGVLNQSSNAQLDVTGANSRLDLQTDNSGTINIGNTTTQNQYSFLDASTLGSSVTLGSGVTINEIGSAMFEGNIVNQGNINQTGAGSLLILNESTFTNNGTITAAASGGDLETWDGSFTNNDTIDISNGDSVIIQSNFNNAATGVISIGTGSTLELIPPSPDSWSNQGLITLASGASLDLGGGSFTLASLGTFTNSGGTISVYLGGTLNNTGSTIDGTNALGQVELDGGTIQGGTVTSAGLALSSGSSGTLSDVTYDGTINLGEETSVTIANGTAVNNAAGTGAGTINDTGQYSDLYFANTETFDNATINLGNASSSYSYLEEYDSINAPTILTLGPNVTVNESGNATIDDGSNTSGRVGDAIVNQGIIKQTGTGSNMSIGVQSGSTGFFTNDGTINAASSAGNLIIETTTFTNDGKISMSNGDTVAIKAPVRGVGTEEISGGSLALTSTVGTKKTLDGQDLVFASGNGSLDLGDPTGFWGEISGFATTDAINLTGDWAFGHISHPTAGATDLTLISNSLVKHVFDFVGDYAKHDFSIVSGTTTTITHT